MRRDKMHLHHHKLTHKLVNIEWGWCTFSILGGVRLDLQNQECCSWAIASTAATLYGSTTSSLKSSLTTVCFSNHSMSVPARVFVKFWRRVYMVPGQLYMRNGKPFRVRITSSGWICITWFKNVKSGLGGLGRWLYSPNLFSLLVWSTDMWVEGNSK